MLRVTLLSHGFHGEYEIGFANGLARNGVDVLLVGSDKTLQSRLAPGVGFMNLRGSQDQRRPKLAKVFNIIRYVFSYLELIRTKRDCLVHVSGLFTTRSTLFSLLEAWLTRLCAGRYFLTVHDVVPHDGDTKFNRSVYRMLYRAPGILVAHTSKVGERLSHDFGVDPARIVVMEHGIDRFYTPAPALRDSFRAALTIPATAPVALFFGKVMRYKGVDLLLDALDRMGAEGQLHVVIMGQCSNAALLAELLERVKEHPFRVRIHWENRFIEEEEIPAMMAGSDFIVLPYSHIYQSGVLFAAFSTGMPLVVTQVGSLADYVPHEVGETAPPNNADAFAQAMARMTTRLTTISREVIASHGQKFAWEVTVRPLLTSYAVGARGAG